MKVEILIVWFLVVVKGRRIVSNAILHQIYIHEELGPLLENSSFLLGCAIFYEYFWNQKFKKCHLVTNLSSVFPFTFIEIGSMYLSDLDLGSTFVILI